MIINNSKMKKKNYSNQIPIAKSCNHSPQIFTHTENMYVKRDWTMIMC